mgnify:CR=1 FL=1
MRVIRRIEELELLLSSRYFHPEYRLYKRILHSYSPKNKNRYIKALVRKLINKRVLLLPEVIQDLYRIAGSEAVTKPKTNSRSLLVFNTTFNRES